MIKKSESSFTQILFNFAIYIAVDYTDKHDQI